MSLRPQSLAYNLYIYVRRCTVVVLIHSIESTRLYRVLNCVMQRSRVRADASRYIAAGASMKRTLARCGTTARACTIEGTRPQGRISLSSGVYLRVSEGLFIERQLNGKFVN